VSDFATLELPGETTEEELVQNLYEHWNLLTPSEKAKAHEFIQGALTKKARSDFYTYVRLMAPVILPEGFIDGKHIKLMSEELQIVERRTTRSAKLRSPQDTSPVVLGKRLQIFLPPGSMKSKILNLFVTWALGRHPMWNIMHIGHSTQFAEDNMGRQIRDVMNSPEYAEIFPGALIKKDVKAAGRWETTKGGKYYATGVGTRIAGRRAHISIVDDAVSEQTAYSSVERPKINEWYGRGLRTRVLPGGSEIIVNTRWHVDDLSGYLLKADESSKMPWKVIAIPAILDSYSAGLLGLPVGHSYWPEFWTDAMLLEKKTDKAFSEAAWNALYMQNPVPEEGNIFKENLFQFWSDNDPPALDYIVVSVDTAFSTREKADFSAYTVWGVFKDVEEDLAGQELLVSNMILLEAEEGRWEFPELCLKMREINDVYQPDTFVVEKKASGQSLIQEMRRRNFPVTEYIPDKDKISRAHACTPFMEAKRIWVPAVRLDDETTRPRSFAEDLIHQAIQFPFAAHDDLTDTFTQAILWMRDSFAVSHPEYDEDEEIEAQSAVRFSYWNMVNPKGF